MTVLNECMNNEQWNTLRWAHTNTAHEPKKGF